MNNGTGILSENRQQTSKKKKINKIPVAHKATARLYDGIG